MRYFKFFLFLIILSPYFIFSQVTNYIFALNNASSGIFYFSRIEIANGNIINYNQALNGWSSYSSVCYNINEQQYLVSDGTTLLTFDALTGNQLSTDTFPLAPGETFHNIRYNPCDSNLYGTIRNLSQISFGKYNKVSGIMTYIIAYPPNTGICMECPNFIDPLNQRYYLYSGGIVAIDLVSGQIVLNTPVINLPNEIFGHIALNCTTHEIFGTSANVNAGIKYLSTIDPITGIVTHVSNTGWNAGIWKPSGGGSFINQLTGDFFYSAAGHTLIGANTASGNLNYNQVINSGELFGVQHASDCNCISTGIQIQPSNEILLDIYPIPTTQTLTLQTSSPLSTNGILLIYTTQGQLIYSEELPKYFQSKTMSVEDFSAGLYKVLLKSGSEIISQKFQKL